MNELEKYKQLYEVTKKELDYTRNESFLNKRNYEEEKKISQEYKEKYETLNCKLNSQKPNKLHGIYKIWKKVIR